MTDLEERALLSAYKEAYARGDSNEELACSAAGMIVFILSMGLAEEYKLFLIDKAKPIEIPKEGLN